MIQERLFTENWKNIMKNKTIQLFCMPFAGGNASAFSELSNLLDESIDVHVIEYPGRGTRNREPYCETMDELIADAKKQVENHRNKGLPFAILGYSMGVEVTFNLAQFELSEKPSHLFIAAREAINYDTNGHDFSLLDKNDFIDKIVALGGISEKLLSNRRFLDIYMKPIYADYKLLYQYKYRPEKGKLYNDITVFYCEKDTPITRIKDWERFTSGKTEYYELGNNHFFIQQHAREMAEIINKKCLSITKGNID